MGQASLTPFDQANTIPRRTPRDRHWGHEGLILENDARGVLRATRDLLAAPVRWTKWADARTATGAATSAEDPHAVAWSLPAAVHVASKSAAPLDHDHVRACATELLWDVTGCLLGSWNDGPTTTHGVVLAALDYAISQRPGARHLRST